MPRILSRTCTFPPLPDPCARQTVANFPFTTLDTRVDARIGANRAGSTPREKPSTFIGALFRAPTRPFVGTRCIVDITLDKILSTELVVGPVNGFAIFRALFGAATIKTRGCWPLVSSGESPDEAVQTTRHHSQ